MKSQILSVLALILGQTSQAFALPSELRTILSDIAAQVENGGPTPIVITDLDETVVDSTTRRYLAVRETLNTQCGIDRSGVCGRIAGLNLDEFLDLPNRYDQDPLLDRIRAPRGQWRTDFMKSVIDAYLSGRYMEMDQAVPGATEFVQKLQAAGAKVFFISSRWKDTQQNGTERSILDLGMAEELSPEQVILRPRGMDSLTFKKSAFDFVKKWAEENDASVELVMENEPENMNAMVRMFPEAHSVFVEGAAIKPEPVDPVTVRVKNFR